MAEERKEGIIRCDETRLQQEVKEKRGNGLLERGQKEGNVYTALRAREGSKRLAEPASLSWRV
eukprot:238598-Hanusia_phi.AAC.2